MHLNLQKWQSKLCILKAIYMEAVSYIVEASITCQKREELEEGWLSTSNWSTVWIKNKLPTESLSTRNNTWRVCKKVKLRSANKTFWGSQTFATKQHERGLFLRVLVMGIAEDCCPKVIAKIHIDQFIDCIAQNCPHLCRLEIRWDDETLRFSDKSRLAYILSKAFRMQTTRAAAWHKQKNNKWRKQNSWRYLWQRFWLEC